VLTITMILKLVLRRVWSVKKNDKERKKQDWKCIRVIQLEQEDLLTLILLTWRIGWAPKNASKRQIGFNWAFKGLTKFIELKL
jgi:hypothetical protein